MLESCYRDKLSVTVSDTTIVSDNLMNATASLFSLFQIQKVN